MKRLLFLIALFVSLAHAQTPTSLLPVPRQQFLNPQGQPLAGGCVFTYISGTSTPLATYTDYTGTIVNSNPVILDSGGFASVWLQSGTAYTITVFANGGTNCATGSQQWSVNGVTGPPNLLAPGPIGTTVPNVVEATYFLTGSASPALSGLIRLASGDSICWRNNTNTADECLYKDTSETLTWPAGEAALVNNCNVAAEYAATQGGAVGSNALAGCVSIPPSTAAIGLNGMAGFAVSSCNSMVRTVCNGVGAYGQGRAIVNYASAWGGNHLAQDLVGTAHTNLTGDEIDVNVLGSPDNVWGLLVTGNFGGTIPASSWAFNFSPTSGQVQNGIQLADGSVIGYGAIFGSQTQTANSASQPVCFNFRDSSNMPHCIYIEADASGDLILAPYAGSNIQLNGSTYLGSGYIFGSGTVNIAQTGVIRLANTDPLCWRNAANSADLCITPGSTNQLLPAVVSYNLQNLASGGTITSGVLTTVDSKSVTMPSTGCPCRAFISYSYFWTTAASATVADFYVTDGTNNFLPSQTGAGTSPVPTTGTSASGFSSVTYANNATVVFTMKVQTNQNITINQTSTSASQNSNFQVVMVPSN